VSDVRLDAFLRTSPLDALDTRVLVMHALGLTRMQLITQSERLLTDDEIAKASALIERRYAGEPIAYLVGTREFYGLPFRVTPDVLIPRPETELLVELALRHLPQKGGLLDLGTGSGAIAVAVAHARPDVRVVAVDASPAALAVAQSNAASNGVRTEFVLSDWYRALENRCFDVIVANPPYIVAGDSHLQQGDLRFEPIDALTDHADGLSALRTITAGAAAYLAADGWLIMEHGYDQADAVRALLEQHGFAEVQSWRDLAGIERASGGRKNLHPDNNNGNNP
jgi:release factor glutamine methyltransferase